MVFHNRQRLKRVDTHLLKRVTEFLLNISLKERDYSIGVTLVGAAEMTRLNESFLRHKGSTDVITFDYSKEGRKLVTSSKRTGARERVRRQSPAPLQGDIIVCVDETELQAQRFRTSWQSELVRYIVHGMLHLCGYDDGRASQRCAMKREENRLLAELLSEFPVEKRLSITARPAKVAK